MPDITMCQPSIIEEKCRTCYRMTAIPHQWQSYSNFLEDCKANEWRNYMEPKCECEGGMRGKSCCDYHPIEDRKK